MCVCLYSKTRVPASLSHTRHFWDAASRKSESACTAQYKFKPIFQIRLVENRFYTSVVVCILVKLQLKPVFPVREFVRANREKSNLIGWRQTLTTSPPNHIRFLLVRAKKIAKWKTGLKNFEQSLFAVFRLPSFAAVERQYPGYICPWVQGNSLKYIMQTLGYLCSILCSHYQNCSNWACELSANKYKQTYKRAPTDSWLSIAKVNNFHFFFNSRCFSCFRVSKVTRYETRTLGLSTI